MAKTLFLKAQTRKNIGRTGLKSVRSAGKVPGVLYGKQNSQPIEINEKELTTVLHKSTSENVLLDLELTDDTNKAHKRLALVQEVQHHPLEDYIIHVDLHEIAQDEKLHTEVSVREVGEAIGLKSGGIFETLLRTLRVECLPKDLPEFITVDVSNLAIGQAIHVGEIALPEGVTVLNHKELSVFAVAAPKEEEATTAVATEAVQPEVIKEKKTDEAAAPAGDKKDAKAEKKDAKK